MSKSDEILTLQQVADLLKVSPFTVIREIERGYLTGFKAGRAWRFTLADVDLYIRKKGSQGLDLQEGEGRDTQEEAS